MYAQIFPAVLGRVHFRDTCLPRLSFLSPKSMMGTMPIPIAILGSSQRHNWKSVRKFEKGLTQRTDPLPFLRHDCKGLMNDPLREDRVSFGEDGTHARTIVAVMGQDKFPIVCEDTMDKMLELTGDAAARGMGIILSGSCEQGVHRVDAWGRSRRKRGEQADG